MSLVSIVVGLPGSGKTTYLEGNFHGRFFDDFHGGSVNDIPTLPNSRHCSAVREALQTGLDFAISDIAYCESARLEQIKKEFRRLGGELGIEIETSEIYFANSPSICKHNIARRFNGEKTDKYSLQVRLIDELSSKYMCSAVGILPVITPCTKVGNTVEQSIVQCPYNNLE